MTTEHSRAGNSEAKGDLSVRDRILEAATTEFVEHGYEGARVDRIAKFSGANKQMIYYYFTSKDGLFQAVLERTYLDFCGNDRAIREAVGGVDPISDLHCLVGYLFRPAAPVLKLQRLLQSSRAQVDNPLKEMPMVRAAYQNLLDVVSAILRQGEESGVFRSGINAAEFWVALSAVCAAMISNAHSASAALGVDLVSARGADHFKHLATDLLVRGIVRS